MMKQCSLTAMFSKPVLTVQSNSKENKEEDSIVSPDPEPSYNNQDENIPTKIIDGTGTKTGESSLKKRLKLTKREKNDSYKVKADGLTQFKTTKSFSNGNEILMASSKNQRTNELTTFANLTEEKVSESKEKFNLMMANDEIASQSECDPPSDSKHNMSYSEFLDMFKSSSCDVSQVDEQSNVCENEKNVEENVDFKDSEKKCDIARCKSIASYFKPSQSKSGPQRPRSSLVTVTAEIHSSLFSKHSSSLVSDHSPNKSVSSQGKPMQKDLNEEIEDIVLISSEVIEDDSETSQSQKKTKELVGKKANVVNKSVTDVKAKVQKQPKEGKSLPPNIAPHVVESLPKTSAQTSFQQSTLSFGKFGLSLCKTVPKFDTDSDYQESGYTKDETNEVYYKTFTTAKSERETDTAEPLETETVQQKNDSGHQENKLKLQTAKSNNDCSMAVDESSHTIHTTIIDKNAKNWSPQENAKLRISDTTENASRPTTELNDTPLTKEDKPDNQIRAEATSTPMLRRSSRIKTNSQAKIEAEVLEIDSDEDKKAEVKKQKKPKQQLSNLDTGKLSTKPQGKLAPIFMKGKPAGEDTKKSEPPEDPEKVRARKEFLMSGIPDELRRVIAATASANVEADYPPLPQPSHVQQISPTLFSCADLSTINIRPDSAEEELFDSSWKRLHWPPYNAYTADDGDRFDKSLPNLLVEESQADVLLVEMEAFNSTFPFPETYSNCLKKKIQDNSRLSSDDIVIVDDESPPAVHNVPSQSSENVKEFLWCDLYQPSHSQEIIGNTKTIKQLKDWLTEWHGLMQKEVLKAAKGKKSQQSSSKIGSDWSADSDFTDSDEEDCRLCNTMLITGPHGIGKTSVVYGLAQEVGFKVFEVNASSLRSGKQLLSQLEEATQSHRVASHKLPDSGITGTPPPGNSKAENPKQSSSKKPKSAPSSAAFANLFRKSSNSAKTSEQTKGDDTEQKGKKNQPSKHKEKDSQGDSSKKKSKKRKVEEMEKGEMKAESQQCKALNISSTSLILFDEADVVFEEDKGFLSTIQYFMTSTKIPIILTSTDPSLHLQLAPRHHHVVFKQPSMKSIASFLYTVSLANRLRTDITSLANMVKVFKGDLRQCLLQLQFWCESGGGRRQVKECSPSDVSGSIHKDKALSSGGQSGQNLFTTYKDRSLPQRKRPRMIIDDDSNSSEASSILSDQESLSEPEKRSRLKRKRKKISETVSMTQTKQKPVPKIPLLHYGCDSLSFGETFPCLSTDALVNFLMNDSGKDTSSFSTHYASIRRILHRDILHSLALYCCGLPLTCHTPTVLEIHVGNQGKDSTGRKKRKRILTDWFDNEASDDQKETDVKENDPGVQNKEGNHVNEAEAPNVESIPSTASDQEMTDVDDQNNRYGINEKDSKLDKNGEIPMEKGLSDDYVFHIKVLSQFSKLYDDRSYADSLEGMLSSDNSDIGLKPGVGDQSSTKFCKDWKENDSLQDLYASVGVLSTKTFTSDINEYVEEFNKTREGLQDAMCAQISSWKNEWNLPIGASLPDIWASSGDKDESSSDQDTAVKNTKDCLGLWAHASDEGIHTDYLPMLREVCRFESDRQAANQKRRFHHYFDYINLGLRESTVTSLATTYKVIESE